MPENQSALTVKDRIILALERSGKSQRELARMMDKSSAAVSEMLSKPGDLDSITYAKAVSDLTGFQLYWLLTGDGPDRVTRTVKLTDLLKPKEVEPAISETPLEYLAGKNVRPVTITVDQSGKELITYVPVKAQAGYRRGYGDPQFVQKLPAFSLPILISQNATHRMFQVDGNSMRQIGGGGLNDGDVVIADYVENVFSMKDNRVYVVITTEGVLVKRVFNRLTTDDKVLVLNSDNKSGEYPVIIVHPHEILEVWEYKAHISRQLTFNADLWQELSEIKAKQAIMDNELRILKGEAPAKVVDKQAKKL